MSVLLLSAAFIVFLAAGGMWAALPLLTGPADADADSPDADRGFSLYPYGWKP
jgi:hypothetical protein